MPLPKKTSMSARSLVAAFLLAFGSTAIGPTAAFGQTEPATAAPGEPAKTLSNRIDELLEAAYPGQAAAIASDAEFLRRIYLDLVGSVPSANEARAFLDNPSPNRRAAVIERLLDSPQFARRMQYVFDVMFMERRPDKQVPSPEWQEYLRKSFLDRKPLHQLAREILSADGADDSLRPAAKFVMDREVEANSLTRDIGRVFFGMDMQCAQCHDHPLIDGYNQPDYYGIMAFVTRSSLFTDANKKAFVAEKADGEVGFKSVFTGEARDVAVPQLPGGGPVVEPRFDAGQEYQVAPADGVRPIPKYSRRAELAKLATSGENQAFNRNLVNRLWALLFGRGIVHPVDLHHADNPPANPQLLKLLADEFVTMNFDVRSMLSQLAMTRAYQRACEVSIGEWPTPEAAAARLAEAEAAVARLTAAVEQGRAVEAQAANDFAAVNGPAIAAADLAYKTAQAETAAKIAADTAVREWENGRKDLATAQETLQLLSDAAAKTQAAVDKVPGDEGLLKAHEQIKTRADQWRARVDELSPLVPAQESAATAATAAWEAARQAAAQAAAEHARTDAELVPKQTAYSEISERLAAEKAALKSSKTLLESAKLVVQIGPLADAARAARESANIAGGKLAQARQAIGEADAQIAQAQQVIASAQSNMDAAAAALAEAQSMAAKKQEAADALVSAAQAAQAAVDKVPGDQPLAEAAGQVKARADQVQAELVELTKAASDRTVASTDAAGALAAATTTLTTLQVNRTALDATLPALVEEADRANATADAAAQELAAKKGLLADGDAQMFLTASLKPLTPEQLAWSAMEVTGVLAANRAAAEAELAAQSPPDPALPPEQQAAARERMIEHSVHEKLKGNVAAFVSVFAPTPGSGAGDFQATVHEALFLANGGLVASWLAPGGGNLTDRLASIEDPTALAEELYLAVLTRRPSADETAEIVRYIAQAGDRRAITPELVWALLSSNEFRFNH